MSIKLDKNGNCCFYGDWIFSKEDGILEIERSSGEYLILFDIFSGEEKVIHNSKLRNYEKML